MDDSPQNNKTPTNRLRELGLWLMVILIVLYVLTSTLGYKVYPESTIFKYLWYSFLFIAFPIILVNSYIILQKNKKEKLVGEEKDK